jgi:Fe-S oxidoreductase
MTKLKAEFLQQYYDARGTPLRSRLIAEFPTLMAAASIMPWAWNYVFGHPRTASWAKRLTGFAVQRTMPLLPRTSLRRWFARRSGPLQPLSDALRPGERGEVELFFDEFTNYQDLEAGQAAVEVLEALGYRVVPAPPSVSGRTYLSKGFLRKARRIAASNVAALKDRVGEQRPLVGIEPSAVLSFRDEYPELLRGEAASDARRVAEHTMMIEEFLVREAEAGRVDAAAFTEASRRVVLHGHCYQKALTSTDATRRMLELPAHYTVEVLETGCCGMAGAFGYEKEHYELSMQIGELVLFPAVRSLPPEVLLAAPGTSCRHQIKDGTGRRALHPVEILREALST